MDLISFTFVVGKDDAELQVQFPYLYVKHYNAIRAIKEKSAWDNVPVARYGQWKGWQKAVYNCIMRQNDRKICFVIDIEGGAGKTVLTKIIQKNHDSFFCTGGKTHDLQHMYKSPNYEIAIFDLSRNPLEKDFHPYAFAEMLKNGQFSSGKYDGCMKRFNPPKVVWMANQVPDRDKLSADRYCVHMISERSDHTLTDIPDMDHFSAPPTPPEINDEIEMI